MNKESPSHAANILVVGHLGGMVVDEVGGRFHAGSKGVRRYIETHAPGVVLCGHIHEAPGTVHLGNTLVVNCSVGKRERAACITMDGTGFPRVTWV